MNTQKWAGIDIAKQELVVGIYPDGTWLKYANTKRGLTELAASMKKLSPELIVMESSGPEYEIASSLMAAGLPVAVVNPGRVRDFAKALGIVAKTDELDAMVIARYGEAVKPEIRPLRSEHEQELKVLLARRRQMVSMLCDEKNRLSSCPVKRVRKEIQAHIDWIEKYIKGLDDELDALIKENPQWREREELLRSVPGVGPVLSKTLIVELPELGQSNRKEIAALTGIAPLNHDSGLWRGARHIHGGRRQVRRTLYICTIAAIRFNAQIRRFYARLIEAGKKPKVAIVACMRKFLTILNAMLKTKTRWQYKEV